MRLSFALVAAITFGCSASTGGFFADGGPDGGGTVTDTRREDTKVPGFDTGTPPPFDSGRPDTSTPPFDTGPVTCAAPFSGTCTTPDLKAGSTVCTDAAITALVNGCFGPSASSSACSSAQTTYASCATCVLTTWLYTTPDGGGTVDTAACIRKISSTHSCGRTVKCSLDCIYDVCSSCDDTPGSGSTSSASEMDDCMETHAAAGGYCYSIATKDYDACAANTLFTRCFPTTTAEVTYFYRGACRDNGNWSAVTTP